MTPEPPSLIEELKRRRVFRAVVGYGVVAFGALQIIEPIMHAYHWPDEVLTWMVTGLAAGFPLVVGLAWIFDVNAGRIERTGPWPGLRGARLVAVLVGISVIAAAPGIVWYALRPHFATAPKSDRAVSAPPVPDLRAHPSIAVLPFVDMSAAKDQEYFADGLAEELLDLLAKVPGLKVTGRTSSFAFKGKNDDLRTIAQKLGVATVLEGSVRKSGELLRITTQLVSASDGYHLWSETYDRKLTDVFAVQDEIAGAVVSALKLRLLPPTGEKPRGTANIEAYNQVLLARQFIARGSVESIRLAQQAFQKAIDLDPSYAVAWAGLSRTTFQLADMDASSEAEAVAQFEQAQAEAEKAVLLGPAVAAAYTARAAGRVRNWNWAGGGADFERALALEPDNAWCLVAYAEQFLHAVGRNTEALTALRKATELDPLSTAAWMELGNALIQSGDQAAAQKALGHALEIAPWSTVSTGYLGLSLLLEGRPEEALRTLQRARGIFAMIGEAMVQHTLGHRQESNRALEAMIAQYAHSVAFQIGEVYAWRGENDKAFEWLMQARAQRDTGIGLLKSSVFLRSLHGDARWKPLLVSVNLPAE